MKVLKKNLTKQTVIWGFKSEKPVEWEWGSIEINQKNKWIKENQVRGLKSGYLTIPKISKFAKELNIVGKIWGTYCARNPVDGCIHSRTEFEIVIERIL